MKTYNETELIAHLLRFKNEYGRNPKRSDFRNNPDYPSSYQYEKIFGSFKNSMLASGLIKDVDHDYWSNLDSLEKFYYLGFLMGDGYVKNDNTVRMKLSIQDIDWIDNFKQNLNIPTKILIEDCRPRQNSIACALNISSKQWVDDLKKYGVINCKTGRERFPIEYCRDVQDVAALCLGLQDSDGSINNLGFDMCGSLDVVAHYQIVLDNFLNVRKNSIFTNKNNTLHQIQYRSKSDLEKIGTFLYQNKNELKNCFLHRKYAKWMEFLT